MVFAVLAGQNALAQTTAVTEITPAKTTVTETAPGQVTVTSTPATATTTLMTSGPITQSVPVTLAPATKPFVVIDNKGCPAVLGAKVAVDPIGYVTTVGCLSGATVFTPDDLITRRDDLLAKVAIMQCRGQLSASAASELIARVHAIDCNRVRPVAPDSTAYYREVKRLYKQFDEVANDIRDISDVPEKQVAGTYSYMTF